MKLLVVCDISGSMSDGVVPLTMRSAVMTVAQWSRLGYGRAEIRLCGWASEVRHFLDWNTRNEFPAELLSCGGASSGDALIQSLGEKPEGKVLLLTDGFWTRDGARVLKRWKERLPPNTLRIIKISAVANPQLKGPDVFAAEDLFEAMDDWLEGGSE